MNAKNVKTPLQQIRTLLAAQPGLLLAASLEQRGIPRAYLTILQKNGEIERVARGVYCAPGSLTDDMAALQNRYRSTIFSHATALYLHDLTDRSPLYFSVTVPSGYNASQLKRNGAKVYFVNRAAHSLGQTLRKTPFGNEVQTYDLERTICDLLRSRKQLDVSIVQDALRQYAARKHKNIPLLYAYARQLRIQRLVKEYIEFFL